MAHPASLRQNAFAQLAFARHTSKHLSVAQSTRHRAALFALLLSKHRGSHSLFTTARSPCDAKRTALMRGNTLLKTLLTTTTMCAALDLYTSLESLVAKPYYKLEQSVAVEADSRAVDRRTTS